MVNKISLSQFFNFSVKVHTSAKINAVRRMKTEDYSVGRDYYRDLRMAIHRYTQNQASLDSIMEVALQSKEDRRANFVKKATKFINFMNKHEVEFFDAGNATWSYKGLININASPEYGMFCDGQKYFVKNFYRKKDSKDKITLAKVRPTLTLMRTAKSQVDLKDATAAILNLQNGRLLFDDKPVDDSKLLELRADAAQLADIWDMI
ncbi:hypothetical protein [Secundilactobacillus kimchicus]|uniref:hypothetical protein n=1 Tax=Secundilactobacillus kimchicus TaxID=528209 RepID=UPI0024A9C288|nr:hypothetical protein [Secundilactobacillus kimchicus]